MSTDQPHAPMSVEEWTAMNSSPRKPAPWIPTRYQIIPAILRAFRSKYAPHVGKKQLARARKS